MTKTEYFPAKEGKPLSMAVKYYLISLVPQGKLTTEKDLTDYISLKYGFYVSDFETITYMQDNYLFKLVEAVPMHRVVSDQGETDRFHADKLSAEGFEILKNRSHNRQPKVVDYKKYLVKFGEDIKVDKELLDQINKDGHFPLQERVKSCCEVDEPMITNAE